MIRKPDVSIIDIEKIARRYAVKVSVSESSSLVLSLGRIPGRYRKTMIRITSENAQEVKGCDSEIILNYGRPDEIPFKLNYEKKGW